MKRRTMSIAAVLFFVLGSLTAGELVISSEKAPPLRLKAYSIEFRERFETRDGVLKPTVGYELQIFSVTEAKEIFQYTKKALHSKITIKWGDNLIAKRIVNEAIGSGRLVVPITKEEFSRLSQLLRASAAAKSDKAGGDGEKKSQEGGRRQSESKVPREAARPKS